MEIAAILTIDLQGRLISSFIEKEINFERSSLTDSSIILERGKTTVRERLTNKCVRKLKITKTQLDYYKSVDSCPGNYSKKNKGWKSLSENERINYHFYQIADGFPFKFELI